MTTEVQRWMAAALVLVAVTYLLWRAWRAWRAASADRGSTGCGTGCGCDSPP